MSIITEKALKNLELQQLLLDTIEDYDTLQQSSLQEGRTVSQQISARREEDKRARLDAKRQRMEHQPAVAAEDTESPM